ncbi:MAG: cation diffusion facilitator family transporter [Candidatus Competibacteraceae bacterium]
MNHANQEKTSVALSSVFASAALTLMKLVVGLLTGSIGILSEAAHSLLDFAAAGLTYFAVRISDKPEDARHPYGHAKIESVSALIETALLFLTSAWIVKEAVHRLLHADAKVETTWYALAVVLVSIVVDFFRARALMRVAKATQSQALEADALHFSSDIYSSAGVLAGLALNAFGYPQADAVAALGVALIVCHAGYELGRRTLDILLDTAPEGVAERVTALIMPIPGVARVDRIRVRPAGKTIFIDLMLSVGRTLSLQRVRAICDEVTARIRAELPDADILAHTQPLALDNETVADRVRLIASAHRVAAHHVLVQRLDGHTCTSFNLEVDSRLSIKEAHDIASTIETAVRAELGEDVEVESHIDPLLPDLIEEAHAPTPERLAEVTALLQREAQAFPDVIDLHHIQIRAVSGGLHIAFHCRFQDDAPLGRVHDTANRLEYRLYEHITDAQRIIVHAEPMRHEDL